MDALLLLTPAVAFVCLIIFREIYRHLHTGFFQYMLASFLSLAFACGALFICQWPPAEAIEDIGMAFFGILLAVASARLLYSFRLAEEQYD
jgi:uncharacterized membrane protein YoaK (UPF0700 family)